MVYTSSMNPNFDRYLLELTNLPTAAGQEHRVIAWISDWADARKQVELRKDRFGNLMLTRAGISSHKPIVLAAHMDHPAFVVTKWDGAQIEATFLGGVAASFFSIGSKVRLHHGNEKPAVGKISAVLPETPTGDKQVAIDFKNPVQASLGDVVTWDLPAAKIKAGRLHAPACDDLAGAAAAVAAFENIVRSRAKAVADLDVRVLLTRAEEVGFIGAMAACKSKILPKGSRIIAIENSRSFADSPIGGGPIVRVGDRTSTFDPQLTRQVGQIAQAIATSDPSFNWQRKLMPGGTCEATAYQTLGHTATCVCLPLGNYHNMNEKRGKIDSEIISLADYHSLIRLLTDTAKFLDAPAKVQPLQSRLNDLFDRRKSLLEA